MERKKIAILKKKIIYPKEPYAQYKKLVAWKVLSRAIDDLIENQDLVETTVRKCIVGYLIKRLVEFDLLKIDEK